MRLRRLSRLAALAALPLLVAGCAPAEPPLPVGQPAATLPGPASPGAAQRAEGSPALERLGVAIREGPRGATVIALDLDGPAARSGAQVGDIVVSFNGTPVTSAVELDRLAGASPSGTIVLEVLRGTERRQVKVTEGREASAGGHATWNALGLQVREVSGETLKALGVSYGIMVLRVRAPADRTRILPGDVIVGVNHRAIHSMEEFERLVADSSRGVALLVRRVDSDHYIAFERGAVARGGASRGGGLPPGEPYRTGREPTGRPLRT